MTMKATLASLVWCVSFFLSVSLTIHVSSVAAANTHTNKHYSNTNTSKPRLGLPRSFFDHFGNHVLNANKITLPLSILNLNRYHPTPTSTGPAAAAPQQFYSKVQRCLLQNIRKKPKLAACATVISTALSYNFFLHASPVHASQTQNPSSNANVNVHAKKMNPRQIVTRTLTFWRRAAPIIIHYKFTQTWFALQLHRDNRTNKSNSSGVSARNNDTLGKEHRDAVYNELHERYAPHALDIILEMRGLFIKIGQVMSSRPDFIPKQYIQAFNQVQDNVPPWEVNEIMDIVSDSLRLHHGLSFHEVFRDFADEPIGSASIGQVHEATLTETFMQSLGDGDGYGHDDDYLKKRSRAKKPSCSRDHRVAVKVMHPDAEDRFKNDFRIFKWLCRIALPGWSPILRELEKQMMTEFNYLNEAASLRSVRDNMKASPYKNLVVVPKPLHCTPNVLIMEFLDGVKLETAVMEDMSRALKGDVKLAKSLIERKRAALFQGDIVDESYSAIGELQNIRKDIMHFPLHQQLYTALQLAWLQRKQRKVVELLLSVHGFQILSNGIFNGDPHPGNILTLKNGKLGLIDYGQCKTLDYNERIALSKIVDQLSMPEVNDSAVAAAMKEFGFRFENDREDTIRETARLFFDSDSGRREVGCATPQEYLLHLQSKNAFKVVPDAAVFVARTSFLFRGMGALLGLEVKTSDHWSGIMKNI